MSLEEIQKISVSTPSKIVFFIIDGLGGLPDPATGMSELEVAATPRLDRLAGEGMCGLADPVSPGITPGSCPGHLALFGYDPLRFVIGRGVVEALGVDFALGPADIAARGNFCTVDAQGIISDRRAGRISTEKCAELCTLLSDIGLEGMELFVRPVRGHRFLLVLRGRALSSGLADSDPERTGVPPHAVTAVTPQGEPTAGAVRHFVEEAQRRLECHHPATGVLLRGFSQLPQIPSMSQVYKVRALAIVGYPTYKGLARVLGMDIVYSPGGVVEELALVRDNYHKYDFFYVHCKDADTAGEDGDFQRKVRVLEDVDRNVSPLLELRPDVLVVTGDHSTPAMLKGHSWHPVPLILHSRWGFPSGVGKFCERACAQGSLGRLPSLHVMPLAMAHALKLAKFGA
ncbi:MAG: 2,3-bisphosphoglycerate-independent phosphoglycerate mutase [Chloroflexota bacterium]